jgi:hypothetical protein
MAAHDVNPSAVLPHGVIVARSFDSGSVKVIREKKVRRSPSLRMTDFKKSARVELEHALQRVLPTLPDAGDRRPQSALVSLCLGATCAYRRDPADPGHSVFGGTITRQNLFAKLDVAWSKRLVKGVDPDDAFRFEIEMTDPVGKNGETKIALIVNPQTKQVITAYPISAFTY